MGPLLVSSGDKVLFLDIDGVLNSASMGPLLVSSGD